LKRFLDRPTDRFRFTAVARLKRFLQLAVTSAESELEVASAVVEF
jgi:hypothetical protein